ncbi:hypothetical protein Dimus_001441 [Dionaea muscipula]
MTGCFMVAGLLPSKVGDFCLIAGDLLCHDCFTLNFCCFTVVVSSRFLLDCNCWIATDFCFFMVTLLCSRFVFLLSWLFVSSRLGSLFHGCFNQAWLLYFMISSRLGLFHLVRVLFHQGFVS